jgi:hypothetical protein
MKKSFTRCITIFLIFFNVHTYAQKYGLQGGVNFSDMIIKDNENTYNTNKQAGFNVGITIGYEISKLAEFEGGIVLESRGSKNETVGINMTYMDYSILFKVGPTIGKLKIYGAAGPYFGTGLSGFFKYTSGEYRSSGMFKWGNDNDDFLKRLDFGTKFGIGVHGVHFNLGVYYSLGLANISAIRDNGIIMHNKGISICVGYMF